jgi:hypothetical protein
MYYPPTSEFYPERRPGVMMLLERVDYDLSQLSAAQLARCRELLFLDTDLSVADLVRAGRIL